MRPMFMEFTDDRTCEVLDKQYMLGNSLLVAPVFKASKEVEYYLPKGKWVHLLDGRILNGERWVKETYDYFSLPLFVRPDSVLVVGTNDIDTVYDYTDQIILYISSLTDGISLQEYLVDIHGNKCAEIRIDRRGEEILIHTKNLERKHWKYLLLDESQKSFKVSIS